MTSNRPYLIRALYEWITDNGLTTHLLVNAEWPEVVAPTQYVQEGRIALNISPSAVAGLRLGNDWVEFNARFGGAPFSVRIPPPAVMAIYARETGQGMVFNDEPEGEQPPPTTPSPSKKPSLKIVK
ncbi:MAG: ClpXP protease specificity-enhancing factor [Gammaproteobacteria bacterium]|nr:ClpXP protease specificity-enhancing factor [Gammaproteobacteria bacterium]MCP5423762.1 ClpXP protease specificity-enhancing factor [Gammaproteobacteria bacterium]